MPIKVAINGFGRIGRPAFRRIIENHPELEIVAINDLADPKVLAHLLKYDSIYGIYQREVASDDKNLIVDGKKYLVLSEKDPGKLPWKDLNIDIVLECTGLFISTEKAESHIKAGAKKVVISAPCKDNTSHYVLGVNEDKYQGEEVISMASCTTNCLAPIARVLHDNLEIESGLMTTMHSYTNSQALQDSPHKDLRRARAAAVSMIPTTTGAAVATTKTIPELEGKIDAMAIRVPTPAVSIIDFVARVRKETGVEEVNQVLKKAAKSERLKGVLSVEENSLVSIDFKQNPFSSIVDLGLTMVIEKNLVKVLSWYDNEWGYSCRLAELAEYIGKKL